MAKLGKRGWSSDFRASNFTADGMERFVDDRRDELYGRHDACGKPGKIIHEHKTFGETPREFTKEELFQTLLNAARGGDCQSQYRVGMEFLKNNDKDSALYWLNIAAERGWPDAVDELKSLWQLATKRPPQSVPVQTDSSPWVKCFYVVPIVAENGERKFVLLLRMSDESSPVTMSKILSVRGKAPVSDVFATYALAKEAGLRCLREWGKR